MMEKEMPKLCINPQSLLSSCLYPNCAKLLSSASASLAAWLARLALLSTDGSATTGVSFLDSIPAVSNVSYGDADVDGDTDC